MRAAVEAWAVREGYCEHCHYIPHVGSECPCVDCECRCHVDVVGNDGHTEKRCPCHQCPCRCHGAVRS